MLAALALLQAAAVVLWLPPVGRWLAANVPIGNLPWLLLPILGAAAGVAAMLRSRSSDTSFAEKRWFGAAVGWFAVYIGLTLGSATGLDLLSTDINAMQGMPSDIIWRVMFTLVAPGAFGLFLDKPAAGLSRRIRRATTPAVLPALGASVGGTLWLVLHTSANVLTGWADEFEAAVGQTGAALIPVAICVAILLVSHTRG